MEQNLQQKQNYTVVNLKNIARKKAEKQEKVDQKNIYAQVVKPLVNFIL
jgi:hypothetical protein